MVLLTLHTHGSNSWVTNDLDKASPKQQWLEQEDIVWRLGWRIVGKEVEARELATRRQAWTQSGIWLPNRESDHDLRQVEYEEGSEGRYSKLYMSSWCLKLKELHVIQLVSSSVPVITVTVQVHGVMTHVLYNIARAAAG